MRVACGLAIVSLAMPGHFKNRQGSTPGEAVRVVLPQETRTASSSRSRLESLQSLDSLPTLMETHGSFQYQIRPDRNKPQTVAHTLTAARVEACLLSWSVTSVSAGTSRVSLTSDLRALDSDKLKIGEMRGRIALIHISFVPSIWELEVPVVEGNAGSNVHSKNLDTGVDTSLQSLFLQLDSSDGAKQVANALRHEIERCRTSPSS
jgi:hypothetical protein